MGCRVSQKNGSSFFPQKNGPSSILAKYFRGKFLERMDLTS